MSGASDSELASIVQEIQALLADSPASASPIAFRLPTPAELRGRRALALQMLQMKRKESEVCEATAKREQEDTDEQSSDTRRPSDAVSAHGDEFKSMLDTVEASTKKPTAQEIRKRLGYVCGNSNPILTR